MLPKYSIFNIDTEVIKEIKKRYSNNKNKAYFYRDESAITSTEEKVDNEAHTKILKYFRSLKYFTETPRVHFTYDIVCIN